MGWGGGCVGGPAEPSACQAELPGPMRPEERAHLTRATWQCRGHACPVPRTSAKHGGISPRLASAVRGWAASSGGRWEKPWTLPLPSAPLPFTNPASPQSLCRLVARSVFFAVDVIYNHIQNVPLQKIRRASSRPKPSRSQHGSPMSSLVTEVVAQSRPSSKAKMDRLDFGPGRATSSSDCREDRWASGARARRCLCRGRVSAQLPWPRSCFFLKVPLTPRVAATIRGGKVKGTWPPRRLKLALVFVLPGVKSGASWLLIKLQSSPGRMCRPMACALAAGGVSCGPAGPEASSALDPSFPLHSGVTV